MPVLHGLTARCCLGVRRVEIYFPYLLVLQTQGQSLPLLTPPHASHPVHGMDCYTHKPVLDVRTAGRVHRWTWGSAVFQRIKGSGKYSLSVYHWPKQGVNQCSVGTAWLYGEFFSALITALINQNMCTLEIHHTFPLTSMNTLFFQMSTLNKSSLWLRWPNHCIHLQIALL